MASRTLILASASRSRRKLLEEAGFAPEVVVSGVDEARIGHQTTAEVVAGLAARKATAVATRLAERTYAYHPPALVLACDSLLDVDGVAVGKPAGGAEALDRWKALRGRSAHLLTGHHLIDLGQLRARRPAAVSAVADTEVRFGTPSDEELAIYVGTGEPLGAAGGFTLEGRSAPFIDGVVGDPSNVMGLSLPRFRQLLAELRLAVHELWR